MRVSVVIPTYNRRELLRECLRSINAQVRPADEIVVVDDGSTDGTSEMIRDEFASVRCIRVPNGGVVAARIVGIAQASHEWIALCDSDDLWTPEFLATRMGLLDRHPQCLYSFGNFRLYDGAKASDGTKFDDAPKHYWQRFGQLTPDKSAIVAWEPPYASLLRFQPVFPSTVVMHRTFYERTGGFDVKLSRVMSEDFEFTLRCGEQAPILVDRSAHVRIRKHASNASGDLGKMLVGDIGILRFARAHHRLAGQYLDIVDDEISQRSRQAAEVYFAEGNLDRFRELADDVAPRHRAPKWRLKHAIAAMPSPFAEAIAQRLVRLRPAN